MKCVVSTDSLVIPPYGYTGTHGYELYILVPVHDGHKIFLFTYEERAMCRLAQSFHAHL